MQVKTIIINACYVLISRKHDTDHFRKTCFGEACQAEWAMNGISALGYDIPGFRRHIPEHRNDIPDSGNALSGFGNDVPGTGRNHPEHRNDIPGFGNALSGFGNNVPGTGRNHPEHRNDVPGFGNALSGFGMMFRA